MAMFGVETESTTGRRLNAYFRDTSNTLALESVLQLLDVPIELALVPTAGFDVASISTARIFGSEDEELAQPVGSAESADAAEATDEAQASEAVDVTFTLEDSVAEATFSENTISGRPVSEDTAAEDDSFEDDEDIEPYPDGYTSPLERSYQLVATGRRVTLAEWMDAINNGHIPYEYTHMGSPEGLAPDSFVDAEEGHLSLDSALREADPVSHEEPHEASVIQRASVGSAALANDAAASDEPAPSTPQDPAPQPPAPQGPFVQGSAPRSRRKRLTPEQIRAKTRRVGLALGADVTAQSAIAMTLAAVARRRRAAGKASRKFSVAAALFALNATVESALIPAVVRSFERTQLEKHGHEGRPAATPAEVVHPGESGREHHPAKRTLIDELREGNYRTAEEPGEESSPNPSLRERVRNMVRRVRAPKER